MPEEKKEERAGEKVETRPTTFQVFRFDPDKGDDGSYKEYKLDVARGTTVLDALIQIKEEQDNTLSFRYSCRMGVCGSCGMYVNGLPVLGCQTQVYDLDGDVIEVKPLPNYEVMRDIACDQMSMFEKHKNVKPYILRKDTKELDNARGEYSQTPENLDWIYQFTYCIKCGLCLSACPTVASDSEFTGPMALTQAYRYIKDSRDEGARERVDIVDHSHGCWRCHFASSCSQVCPKGVDPALAIQLLKREVILHRLWLRRQGKGSELMPKKIKGAKRKEGVPDAPEKTV